MKGISLGQVCCAVLLGLVNGCSYVEVPYGGNQYVTGRTMELGGLWLESKWTVQALQRGWSFPTSFFPSKMDRFSETARLLRRASKSKSNYGIVGVFGGFSFPELHINLEVLLDGMNEHGLSVGAHTHRGAKYQAPVDGVDSIQFLAFVPWVLANYKNVQEVVEAIESGELLVTSRSYVPSGLGIHFYLADSNGKSVVVEYVNGKPMIHDNTVRVMTNDPEFDWQLRNLNQYAGIGPTNPSRKDDCGEIDTEIGPVPRAVGHGFNLFGLPGDSGPPARFVRMFVYKQLALYSNPPKNERDGIVLCQSIINSVEIPLGVVPKISKGDFGDFTQWALIKIPSTRKFMYRSYDNMKWKSIDMPQLVPFFENGSKPNILHVFTNETGIEDVTSKFTGA
uniref:Choloylglycine hydrolase/NAAA C-terminal domain-containing protein n=1 Tax=Mucochytrium quahogii TaxID=96639 RepID=A0A7S2RR39_9STRA|mmetsp:Transcript_8227/g.13308  ORF Transcript_8227/g.13308 Transcript_8227/m.13308 type:complete len:394 (+) Transcript_8227:331-1512(+)|eukprot:CAMPEP_0203800738 /NCGR_PEP_ID=MMETSP0100_2-20121128/10773_1 /ASSEMBLY_ACC=CAM_ASM_000210 /TAXON_ID=96639 /ORGANISM=" , Strain NY0313808BC1" /LENGTH=393 /DNA_ID=CAMNT_0050707033 /DNA_START=250 /DNA_END=1431 /DNA_ORIENTATION=-